MVLSRRRFLANTGVAIASGALMNIVSAAQVKFLLKTVEDKGPYLLPFDPTRAEKAVKLATYVIKDEDAPQAYHNISTSSLQQIVEVEIVIDGTLYDITVMNLNKETYARPDSITIKSRPSSLSSEEDYTILQDHGLDGRCDYGRFAGKRKKQLRKDKDEADVDFDRLKGSDGIGFEHQVAFQKLYEKALDNLISFYERKGK